MPLWIIDRCAAILGPDVHEYVGDDFDGDYIEIGWGTTISEIDIGIAGIFSSEELSDQLSSQGLPDESEAIVFSIGKTF